MAGANHRKLVQLLITRMQALGYRVVASDQHYTVLGHDSVPIPPSVARHSPDVIGARSEDPILCVGEAKTPGDLRSRHTREQLRDFASLPDSLVIVAVPRSAIGSLRETLRELGIDEGPRFQCMAVPDELIGR